MVDRAQSEFVVQANLIKVIHGDFSPGEGPATLIVAEFQFLSSENSRRFRKATIELLFADSLNSKTDGSRDPEVVRISPSGKNSLNPTREKVTTKHPNFSTKVGSSNVKLRGGIGWGISKSFGKEYQTSIIGVVRLEGRNRGNKNQAKWGLLENSGSGSGVPSLFRCATLLKRSNNDDFIATIKIEVKVDKLYSLNSKMQGLLGKNPKDDLILFNPEIEPFGDIPDDMDIGNLSTYDLAKLSAVESV